jgi:hypothetical protein
MWLSIILLIGAILPLNFYVGRFSGVIPILFILICFAIQSLWKAWNKWFGPRRKRCFALCLAGLSGLALYFNYDTFFGKLVHDNRVRAAYENGALVLCQHLSSLPPDTYIYLWSESPSGDVFFNRSDYSWVCQNLVGEPLTDPIDGLPIRGVPSTNVVYAVLNPLGEAEEIMGLVKHFYPEASCRLLAGEQGNYTIVFCQISGRVISQRRGPLQLDTTP